MRRKLYFCLALTTVAIVGVGLTWNHTIGAQDAPAKKAAEPEKKSDGDLFDLLRQKFEAKSEKPMPVMPDLPLPTAQVQTPAPTPLPKAPLSGEMDAKLPAPLAIGEKSNQTLPAPTGPMPPMPAGLGALPPIVTPPLQDLPKPQLATPTQVTPAQLPTPPLDFGPPPMKAPLGSAQSVVDGSGPATVNATPLAKAGEPIKLKGSAWSLYVEMVNGQTVVTATVNKKHEFKIVCQHLDLQTGAGVMKAKGKVQISGDALSGSCEQLLLPLHDDRLVLEGAAEVRIQKLATNVSDVRSTAFELKGDKLDLRIGELQSSAFIETSWRKVGGEDIETKTIPAALKPGDDARWTTYGKLGKAKNETNLWSLIASDGKLIAYVMAREGGSLDQYVGRTIAVFGAREGERAGQPLVRVTHIAVP